MPQAASRLHAQLGLSPRIKSKHIGGFIVHCTASITFIVLVNSLQPLLISYLLNREGHGEADARTPRSLGRLNSTLLFCDEAVAIIAVLFWGSLAEIIGTRSVAVLGYLLVAVGLNAFAVAQNAWPHLLIARLVFALGASAVTAMLSGLLASFTRTEDPAPPSQAPEEAGEQSPLLASSEEPRAEHRGSGRFASVAGFSTGIGALLAVFGLLRLPPILSPERSAEDGMAPLSGLRYTLGLSAAASLIVALALRFTLPAMEPLVAPESSLPASTEEEPSPLGRQVPARSRSLGAEGDARTVRRERMRTRLALRQSRSFSAQLRRLLRGLFQGLRDARRDRTLVSAYTGGALARATTVGTTAFLPLLVAHFFYTSGLCTDLPDPTLPASEIKARCRQAFTWTSIISGVAQLTALLLSPFIGIIADAISPELTLAITALSGITGYLIFGFALPGGVDGDPRSSLAIVAAALMGVCQIGAIICSLALLGKARRQSGCPAGPLAGAYSFVGGLAILATSAVGVFLFDLYAPSPFIMLAVLAAATAGISTISHLTRRRRIQL